MAVEAEVEGRVCGFGLRVSDVGLRGYSLGFRVKAFERAGPSHGRGHPGRGGRVPESSRR